MGEFAKRIAEQAKKKGSKAEEADEREDLDEADEDVEENDEDEEEEDEAPAPKKAGKKTSKKPVEEDDEDEDLDDEDETPPPAPKKASKRAEKPTASDQGAAIKKPATPTGLPDGVTAHLEIHVQDSNRQWHSMKIAAPAFTHEFIRMLIEAAKG